MLLEEEMEEELVLISCGKLERGDRLEVGVVKKEMRGRCREGVDIGNSSCLLHIIGHESTNLA